MTKTTYEIVEDIPKILKTGVPLMDIFTLGAYFITLPFYFLYQKFKNKATFTWKPKKMEFDHKENPVLVNYDLLGKIDEDDNKSVIKTTINFLYKKEAKEKIKFLIKKGYNIPLIDLNSFYIREKIEINSVEEDDVEIVRFSYPEYAFKLAKFFRLGV